MSNTFLRALDHGGEPSDAEVEAFIVVAKRRENIA